MSRLIDADKLKEVLEKNFGHTGGASVLAQLIDAQDTIQPEPHWIPVTKEEMFKAGYEGREIRFRVDGRLFAIRELAQ